MNKKILRNILIIVLLLFCMMMENTVFAAGTFSLSKSSKDFKEYPLLLIYLSVVSNSFFVFSDTCIDIMAELTSFSFISLNSDISILIVGIIV